MSTTEGAARGRLPFFAMGSRNVKMQTLAQALSRGTEPKTNYTQLCVCRQANVLMAGEFCADCLLSCVPRTRRAQAHAANVNRTLH